MEGNKITPPKSPIKSFSTQKNSKPMTNANMAKPAKKSVVTGSEKVQVAPAKPINSKKTAISIVVAVVAILIIAAITLILIYPRPTRVSDISIKFDTDFSYAPIGSDIEVNPEPTANYKVMPGDTITCNFTI